ncbi:hypothetical protein ACFRDV_12085 [Streptomyces fagopyri]|uniref:hypothetical protein n=1 Tax=Streptomyces fagopyri TaxID=2662397 RepID=UPI0036800B04
MAEHKSDRSRADKKNLADRTPEEQRGAESREGRTAQEDGTAHRLAGKEAREAGHTGSTSSQPKRH